MSRIGIVLLAAVISACTGGGDPSGTGRTVPASADAKALVPGLASWEVFEGSAADAQAFRVVGHDASGAQITDTILDSSRVEFIEPAYGEIDRASGGDAAHNVDPGASALLTAIGLDLRPDSIGAADGFAGNPACNTAWFLVFMNCEEYVIDCVSKDFIECAATGPQCVASIIDLNQWCNGENIPNCSTASEGEFCCTSDSCGYQY